LSQTLSEGSRCEIIPTEGSGENTDQRRRGKIAYIGELADRMGVFVGVHLDEPLGKNDGSLNGHSYFQAAPRYGVFVRPSQVNQGDFPEIDPFDEDYDEEDEM
jgi:tubulin-specific chaperone B